MTEAEWRPACGVCGSTAISVTTMRCADCRAEWDGSEAPQPVREDELPTSPVAAPPPVDVPFEVTE
jgi:hypothetical protein